MIRLQKYLSETGFCSRREAEQLIRNRKITINGRVARPGDKVSGKETILVNGRRLKMQEAPVRRVVAFYKPAGVDPTFQTGEGQQTLADFDFGEGRLFSIGKLDRDAEGLLLLTNDGELGNMLAQPDRKRAEEYILRSAEKLTPEVVEAFEEGMVKGERAILPMEVEQSGGADLLFKLDEGRCKQIRKLAQHVGLEIAGLKRRSIGYIGLGDLRQGQWRQLTEKEITSLKEGKPVKTGCRRVVQTRK